MRTLLIAALLLSLVASIYSQAVPVPTSEQLQCITDASSAQEADLANICGSADRSNVRTYESLGTRLMYICTYKWLLL